MFFFFSCFWCIQYRRSSRKRWLSFPVSKTFLFMFWRSSCKSWWTLDTLGYLTLSWSMCYQRLLNLRYRALMLNVPLNNSLYKIKNPFQVETCVTKQNMLVQRHFPVHVIEEICVRIWQRNFAWDWLNIYYDPLKPILKERLYIFPITELGFQHVKRNIRLFAHGVACLLPDNPK
jgi:hypothetical protein